MEIEGAGNQNYFRRLHFKEEKNVLQFHGTTARE